MTSLVLRFVVCFVVLVLVSGCSEPATESTERPEAATWGGDSLHVRDSLAVAERTVVPDTLEVSGVQAATARLEATGIREIRGEVRLRQLEGGVRVSASVTGLRETRLHGFQILRGSSCDEADPDVHLGEDLGAPHGGPYRLQHARHIGDLGNIRGGDGDGRYDRIDPVLRLNGTHSPVGRAVVVRAEADDATTPGGGAGEVLACGVFQAGR